MNLDAVFGTQLNDAPTSRYFYYQGQPTFQPCSGSINWYVFEAGWTVSASELAAVQTLITNNNNPKGTQNYKTAQSWTDFDTTNSRKIKRGGCYPGYWTHDMTTNAGIWYMIPFMVIFFVITLVAEPETPYENNQKFRNDYRVRTLLSAMSHTIFR